MSLKPLKPIDIDKIIPGYSEERLKRKMEKKRLEQLNSYWDQVDKIAKGEIIMNDGDQSLKKDKGKLRMSLVPPTAVEKIAEVLMFGINKGYGEDSWKQVEPFRYKDAALRHIYSYLKGEKLDEESGLEHLYHAICCLIFISEIEGKPKQKKIKIKLPKVNKNRRLK